MKTGSCQCGAIRFEVSGTAREIYACHCGECRKQSASAFGISVIHAPDDLHIISGTPKEWSRPTTSGGSISCAFCEICGSRLWHASDGIVSIKGGALDEPPDVQAHIWTSRKVPWLILPDDAQTYPQEPDA